MKLIRLACFCLVGTSVLASKTVLVARSIATDPVFELGLTYHQQYERMRADDRFGMDVQAKPFFVSSTQPCRMASYLLPCCCGCSGVLSVREDGLGSVASPWLYLLAGVGSQFNSTLSLRPLYRKAGVLFNIRMNFDNMIPGTWLSAIIAPMAAWNRLNMCEISYGAPGAITGRPTIVSALNSYQTSKFCNKVTVGGFDDIQLKFGYSLKPRNRWLAEGYLVGVIPASNAQKSCYFFEPQTGDGHHGALGLGVTDVLHVHTGSCWAVDWVNDVKYLYLFKHGQTRVFDLTNGDWSRYLLGAFQDAPEIGLPLIRVLTKKCWVVPGAQVSWLSAFHAAYKCYQFELGGNFWWRQRECVSLCDRWLGNTGIFDLAGAMAGSPVSASTAHINQTAGGTNAVTSDTVFTKTSSCAINACSAAQPHAYTFKLYGGLGIEANDWSTPGQLGIGGFYEWSNHTAPLNQWGVWLTTALQF